MAQGRRLIVKAQCPCCKGKKFTRALEPVLDKSDLFNEVDYPCTHCEGTGEVEVEIEVKDVCD